jgi:hypothetical protein
MVRDISAIRQSADIREGQKPPQSKVRTREVQSISSLRSKEQHDEGMPLLVEKAFTARKLAKILKTKRIELLNTSEATKQLVKNATTEADRIVSEAKTKASELITQAQSDKDLATNLLAKAKSTKKKLEDLEVLLTARETTNNEQKEKLEQREVSVSTKEAIVEKDIKTASKAKEQIVDMLGTTLALLGLCAETAVQAQNLGIDSNQEVSQILAKADTIVSRVSVLIKSFDSDKVYIESQKQKLLKREDAVKDKEQSNKRVWDEIQELKQKYG